MEEKLEKPRSIKVLQWAYRLLGFFFGVILSLGLANLVISFLNSNYSSEPLTDAISLFILLSLALLCFYFSRETIHDGNKKIIQNLYAIAVIIVGTIAYSIILILVLWRSGKDDQGLGGLGILVLLVFLWVISAILILIGTIFHFILKRKLKHFRS